MAYCHMLAKSASDAQRRRHFGSPIAANGHDTIARSRPALPMSAPRAAKALDRGAFPGRSSSRGGRKTPPDRASAWRGPRPPAGDRKSAAGGKRGPVAVDLGGLRIINKEKTTDPTP